MPPELENQHRLLAPFFQADTVSVARDLLGKTVVRRLGSQLVRGIIVETEAYLPSRDPASHSHCGLTRRNATMFLGPGKLYVYSIHRQHCMNVVTEAPGLGAAVLIRGIEPVEGIEYIIANRQLECEAKTPPLALLQRCTRGPGRLCSAFGISLQHDATDLVTSDQVWIEDALPELSSFRIRRSTRIGISKAVERKLRFFVDGNHFVSGCARDHSNGRKSTFI